MLYQGSLILAGIASQLSIPLDHLNFAIGQLAAFCCGVLFRKWLKPCQENTFKRHLLSFIIGISISYFCFGPQIIHLVIQSFITYSALFTLPKKYSHIILFIYLMGHLSALHLYRMVYFYGIYGIDITGAVMITTQKLTSFAFFYHDGIKNSSELTEKQRKNLIKKLPSLVEFFGYVFSFQIVLIGPLIFYNDYKEFICGDNILIRQKLKSVSINGKNHLKFPIQESIKQPDNEIVLLKKFLGLMVLALAYHQLTLGYDPIKNLEAEAYNQSLWHRFFYMNISALGQRCKYYLAWQIADMVCNASGLGFNGYDENGKAKWNLCSSVDIIKLETSTSIKEFIDNWNISTQKWIRLIAYERLPQSRTLAAFLLSALWHGFYFGYYCTFVSTAFLVYAGRGIRQNVRPIFQKSDVTKIVYALITWFGTIVSINYVALPFVLLDFGSSIRFYRSWYFAIHIISLVCILVFPYKKKSVEKEKANLAKIIQPNTDREL